ncbi:response regulator transcription factor [Geitlerinema splendidum]|nr:response regulator transcription factor [Geitlerinema splendidum]
MRILLIEDDVVIASELERALRKEGHDVTVAHDGELGLQLAQEHRFFAILLDVMLPGIDGWEVCRRIRSQGDSTPILMLTARDAVQDRVRGLDLGADDYIVKPFSVQELFARLRAIARRESEFRAEKLMIADLEIDGVKRLVKRGGKLIDLTPREYALLVGLARHTGHVLTREVILERLWGTEDNLPNSVNFHMSSLRKKIDDGFTHRLIHTVHGVGYVMRAPEPGSEIQEMP